MTCPSIVCIQALMALFVLASKDGWVQIMYTGLDAVGVDQQVIYSILYYIIQSYIFEQLFNLYKTNVMSLNNSKYRTALI